jgi:hypothetical protein
VKYAVEMSTGGMIYVLSFIKRLRHSRVVRRGLTYRHTESKVIS